MSALFTRIEKALVNFQGTLAKASMDQYDHVDRLAKKTGAIYDKMQRNAAFGGAVKCLVQIAGASFTIHGAITKSANLGALNGLAPNATEIAKANFNHSRDQINATAEIWAGAARACDAATNFAAAFFDSEKIGFDKGRELTQTEMSQQAATRSSMTNIEQYNNTLEQRVDSQKQSARQVVG